MAAKIINGVIIPNIKSDILMPNGNHGKIIATENHDTEDWNNYYTEVRRLSLEKVPSEHKNIQRDQDVFILGKQLNIEDYRDNLHQYFELLGVLEFGIECITPTEISVGDPIKFIPYIITNRHEKISNIGLISLDKVSTWTNTVPAVVELNSSGTGSGLTVGTSVISATLGIYGSNIITITVS